jgi:hypothetical protein
MTHTSNSYQPLEPAILYQLAMLVNDIITPPTPHDLVQALLSACKWLRFKILLRIMSRKRFDIEAVCVSIKRLVEHDEVDGPSRRLCKSCT